MSDDVSTFRATLDAWREQGADRHDPVRFHFMEALERRSATHDGDARRVLDEKLAALLETYAIALNSTSTADKNQAAAPGNEGALTALVKHTATAVALRNQLFASLDATPPSSHYPTLQTLDEFKKIWSTVRAGSQLRQTLEQVPENAGPLNSGALVHRSIGLMRELSPGYLQQFLSYIDALAWVELMQGSSLPSPEATRAPAARKRSKSKPRTPS